MRILPESCFFCVLFSLFCLLILRFFFFIVDKQANNNVRNLMLSESYTCIKDNILASTGVNIIQENSKRHRVDRGGVKRGDAL